MGAMRDWETFSSADGIIGANRPPDQPFFKPNDRRSRRGVCRSPAPIAFCQALANMPREDMPFLQRVFNDAITGPHADRGVNWLKRA